MIELPIIADAAQTFVTQLGLFKLKFDIQWNDRTNQFSLTLSDDESDVVYFQGQPMVLGQDYLGPYNYGLGGLVLVDGTNTGTEADVDTFGDRVKLYWFSEDEVANANL